MIEFDLPEIKRVEYSQAEAQHVALANNLQVVYLNESNSEYLLRLIKSDWNRPRQTYQYGEYVDILGHIKALGFFDLHEEYSSDLDSQLNKKHE